MRPALSRLPPLVMLGSQLVACTSWQTQTTSPQQLIDGEPGDVRIIAAGGKRVVLLRPRIQGDSLVGELPAEAPRNQPSTIALADIESLAVHRPDPTRTTLLLTGLVAAAVGFMFVLANDTAYETGAAVQIGE